MKVYVVTEKINKNILDLFSEKEMALKFIDDFKSISGKNCRLETYIIVERVDWRLIDDCNKPRCDFSFGKNIESFDDSCVRQKTII